MPKNKTSKKSKESNRLTAFIAGTLSIGLLAILYRSVQSNNQNESASSTALAPESKTPDTTQQLLTTLTPQNTESVLAKPEQLKETVKKTESTVSLSDSDKKLQDLRKQSPLNSWLKRSFIVEIDDRIVEDEALIQEAANKCTQAFKEIIKEASFFPNFLPETDLKIILIPPSVIPYEGGNGLYIPENNSIGIVYRRERTLDDYKRTLRNEFFTHQVLAKNFLDGIQTKNKDYLPLPFLEKNGGINKKAFEKFEAALEEVKRQVKKIRNLLAKNKLDEKETQLLDTLLSLSESYSPRSYYLTEKRFKEFVKVGYATPLDSNGRFFSTSKVTSPNFYGYKEGNKFVYTHCKDKDSKSKAFALLSDIQDKFIMSEDSEAPYRDLHKPDKLAEIASFIAESDISVLKFLFPDFYEYMLDFFTKGPNPYQTQKTTQEQASKKQTTFAAKEKQAPTLFEPTSASKSDKQKASKEKHTTTQKPPNNKPYQHGAR